MHSNPPVHGAYIVERVLSDNGLQAEWQKELEGYRNRLIGIREIFAQKLDLEGFNFYDVGKQRGLFSLLPLSVTQAQLLRNEYAVYMLDNGRVNIAGLRESNLDYTVNAIDSVLKKLV